MKKYFLLILFFNCLFFYGCHSVNSLDQTIYVDSMGLNYNENDNTYDIYYHIASSETMITTEMGGSSSDAIYSIGHVNCSSIYEGIKILTGNSIKNIVLTHIQSIIFTFDFITIDNLKEFIDLSKTYNFISSNYYVFATQSKLEDIYTIENPENISPFFSIITSNDYISTYDLVYFTEFSRAMTEDYLVNKFVVIEASDEYWQNENNPIITVSPIGNLYINKEGLKVFFKNEDYSVLDLINFEYSATLIYNDINYTVYHQKIKIKEKNNEFFINIAGDVYATQVTSLNQKETIDFFNQSVEIEFKQLIDKTQKENIDILNLENHLYRKNKLKSDFDYKVTEISINANFRILN